MEITFKQDEIVAALTKYVNDQGIDTTGKKVDVTLIAGRGPNGHTAVVDIIPNSTSAIYEGAVNRMGRDLTGQIDDDPASPEPEKEEESDSLFSS